MSASLKAQPFSPSVISQFALRSVMLELTPLSYLLELRTYTPNTPYEMNLNKVKSSLSYKTPFSALPWFLRVRSLIGFMTSPMPRRRHLPRL
ncbi:hypothetical protein Nepgr_012883 [Nepenthes gracilis]|uniref:Uncharacterized protein n=1 Tax=Nepenthes gracilis TaxID=150966 RepID=A0AAD3SI21_NEPGR|nr:hypothetical protein Nepgr_012883 [Nepenthes gracilis]